MDIFSGRGHNLSLYVNPTCFRFVFYYIGVRYLLFIRPPAASPYICWALQIRNFLIVASL